MLHNHSQFPRVNLGLWHHLQDSWKNFSKGHLHVRFRSAFSMLLLAHENPLKVRFGGQDKGMFTRPISEADFALSKCIFEKKKLLLFSKPEDLVQNRTYV